MKKSLHEFLKPIRQQLHAQQRAPVPVRTPASKLEPEQSFAELFQDVKPLKTHNHYDTTPLGCPTSNLRRAHPVTPVNITTILSDCFESTHGVEYFTRPDVPRLTLKKMRKGHWPILFELDLHGYNRHQAYAKLIQYLKRPRFKSGCIRIIHGKGLHSTHHPILKNLVRYWLQQHPDVLAFCEAPADQGGSGTIMVLLRRNIPKISQVNQSATAQNSGPHQE